MSERINSRVPKYNYFDYKSGRCSDIQYFRSAYGGTVTKHYAERDAKKSHPFFLIIRKADDCNYTCYEAKVYDLTRGLLDKEQIYEQVSNATYWNGTDEEAGYKDSFRFRDYVQFLADSFMIEDALEKAK